MFRTRMIVLAALVLLAATSAGRAYGQCMLANPSFELPGSAGATFAGWSQFGSVGSASNATHGAVSARVSGPSLGGWDVSAYWQSLDAAPGVRWAASVRGWHSATKPLVGQSRAILNIEWRDSGGNLITYESHTVADAATTPDSVQAFSVESQPAPTGTASVRILLGVLQAPTDPSPDVFYDQATFVRLGTPSLDDLQWSDFPGGNTLAFSGRTWRVKGPGYYGPGPSLFCDTSTCTWVDTNGRLHLTIKTIGGSWYSTEVVLDQVLGYGDYVFTTVGRLDTLDPKAVFGIFVWEYGPCYDPATLWWNPYNEIDIEFSRWGNAGQDPAQFVAQPHDYPGNLVRFPVTFSDGELTSHAFRWLHDRVEFRSWRGGPDDESQAAMIHSWTYTGPHIPRPDQPRVHLNLWQFNGPPAVDQEVVLDGFRFVPEGGVVAVPPEDPPVVSVPHLRAASPNPFSPRTSIGFTLATSGPVVLAVCDVAGRLVRTLVDGLVPAGEHEVAWDGRDEAGSEVASGVYLYRLWVGDVLETRRVVRMR